ncbi:glycoprotein A33 (transmembrane), paralog a [Diretmus argenteus]
MERRVCSLVLLCSVLPMAGALTVTIPQKMYEYARGDNITLPCSFIPKKKPNPIVIVTWTAEGNKPGVPEALVLTHYSTGQTDIPPLYEGRAQLDKDMATGKVNLKLSSITLADNKVFECRVQIPGDDEGTLAAITRLVVLVAPSTPKCQIQGKAEYGQNINLTCLSDEGSPPPTYKWDSRDVRNMPRVADPRTTDKGGILSLYNISKDTSGYYICTSSNKIRSASCNVTLSVLPPSMNMGSTAWIIGVVVAGLIVLIIIAIYCCCCRKKKNKEEDYAMGVHEEGEFRDKEPVQNGESHHDDKQEDVRSDDDASVRKPTERRDQYEERSEREYDRRSDYDDRRSDYDDRRSDYSDRRDRSQDRHERYDDDDRRRYDDERRYDDRRERRRDDDRYRDEPYSDSERGRSPTNKPHRTDYDD